MKDFGLSNDLQEILTRALEEMKAEAGERFSLEKVYLWSFDGEPEYPGRNSDG